MKLSRNHWLIIGFGIFIVVLVAALFLFTADEKVTQPIAFNHKKHYDNNVTCNVCHRFYNTEYRAGIPPVTVCLTCHEDVIYTTPEKAKIQNYARQHKAIPWRQVYKVPAYVFFSHRLHVKQGSLACESCHGAVWQREQPVTKQLIPLKMKLCIGCHQNVKRINNPYECIRCHR